MAPISDSELKGQRRQDLFDLSLSLDPAERNDFLVRRCAGDDVLRREVLALIRESEAKGGGAETRGRESADSEEPYRPGQRLGHYLIHDRIGHGGMGIVYRALDERLDRTVALKCLPPHLSRDDVSRQRFIVEAKSASRLDHPNICVIYDIGDSESGDLFLTMPYYDGETLDKRVARGPLSLTEAMSVTAQLCEGLSAAHDEGIVHRDIKPSNILLTTSGVVKILDFGLAKMGRLEMTQTGFQVGTLAYMAPERLAGGEVDLRADLWALGVVMFELVTGERPWVAAALGAAAEDATELYVPASQRRPQLPAQLDQVLMKALAPHPARRHSSALDFLQHLRAAYGVSRGRSMDTTPIQDMKSASAHAVAPDSDPIWTEEQLSEIVSELTRRIGPIAPMLVRKVSSRCTSWAELCQLLADELPSEQDRQSFIHFSSQRSSSADRAQSSEPAPAPSLREPRLQLSERATARITEGLSREVGPIARELMARRLHMDRTVKDLCESLAEFIDDRDSRARFLGSVRDLC